MHNHPVFDGIYNETLNTIFGLIINKVSKIRTANNSTIAFTASKEFLDSYLIHTCLRPKEILQ
jgi:hypothetical protein